MKVQVILSWCLVSELSPLARSIHLKHGKYIYHINFFCASVSYVCYIDLHITFTLSCRSNYEIVYVIYLSIKKTHNILTHENK